MKKIFIPLLVTALLITGCTSQTAGLSQSTDQSVAATVKAYAQSTASEYLNTKNIPNFYSDPNSVIRFSPTLEYQELQRSQYSSDNDYIVQLKNQVNTGIVEFKKSASSSGVMYLYLTITDDRLPKQNSLTPTVSFFTAIVDTEMIAEIIGIFNNIKSIDTLTTTVPKEATTPKTHITFLYEKNNILVPAFSDNGDTAYYFEEPLFGLTFNNDSDLERFEQLRQEIITRAIEKYIDAYMEPSNYPFLS